MSSNIVLVCAATSVEANACRQGISRGITRAGLTGRYEVLQTGMGLIQARHALKKRLTSSHLPLPSRVISTGFAGSWTNELAIGSWIFGKSVEAQNRSLQIELENFNSPRSFSFPVNPARVISIEQASSKGQAHAQSTLPIAVDMESFAWAEICKARNIPFQILRLVSDNPSAPLPDAIGTFASVATAPTVQGKFQSLTRGLSQAFQEPKALAGFIARGTRLPGLLAKGWQEIASE
jgi:nucleoside phosphorylase